VKYQLTLMERIDRVMFGWGPVLLGEYRNFGAPIFQSRSIVFSLDNIGKRNKKQPKKNAKGNARSPIRSSLDSDVGDVAAALAMGECYHRYVPKPRQAGRASLCWPAVRCVTSPVF